MWVLVVSDIFPAEYMNTHTLIFQSFLSSSVENHVLALLPKRIWVSYSAVILLRANHASRGSTELSLSFIFRSKVPHGKQEARIREKLYPRASVRARVPQPGPA